MFNRRRDTPPAEPPETGPDVYTESEGLGIVPGGTIRFFFTEDLTDEDASGIQASLEKQLLFLRSFSLRPYKNYLAVSWIMKDDDDRYLDDVGSDVHLVVLGALASRFGWEEPKVAAFHNREERLKLMKQLGKEWAVGSY